MRSSSACAGSAASYGQRCRPMQPMFTAHMTWARSATTSALEVVPFGVATTVVSAIGRAGRDALLVEGLACRPVGKPLEHGGPTAGRRPQVVADGEVIGHQVELGGAEPGEVHLVRP